MKISKIFTKKKTPMMKIVPDGVTLNGRCIRSGIPYHLVQGIAERESFVAGFGNKVDGNPPYDYKIKYSIWYCADE